jgi:hypothetical protein
MGKTSFIYFLKITKAKTPRKQAKEKSILEGNKVI